MRHSPSYVGRTPSLTRSPSGDSAASLPLDSDITPRLSTSPPHDVIKNGSSEAIDDVEQSTAVNM